MGGGSRDGANGAAAAAATISAAPKKYSVEEMRQAENRGNKAEREAAGGAARGGGDALAMAMLGVKPPPHPGKGGATKAMGVDDFLAKGNAGAKMPRKKQDRAEHEKNKRQKGQNDRDSVEWKSEAEMVLRQQYDS